MELSGDLLDRALIAFITLMCFPMARVMWRTRPRTWKEVGWTVVFLVCGVWGTANIVRWALEAR